MVLSRGRLLGVFGAVAVAAIAGLLVWPREVPPDEQVRRNVVKMVHAAQEKDIGGITRYVSEAFKGQAGGDKSAVKALLLREVLRGTWTKVFIVGMDTSVVSSSEVTFNGRFIFGRSDAKELKDLAKESVIESFVIEGKVVREDDGEWRFLSAKYRRADPGELLP